MPECQRLAANIAQLALQYQECQGLRDERPVPIQAVMRQLTPRTNLLLAVLGGLGLLASLALPWYAVPTEDPNPTNGPVERGAYQVAQVFATSAKGTVAGADALGEGRSALIGVVGVVALLAALVAIREIRRLAEDALRVVALAAPFVLLIAVIDHGGTRGDVRLHYGMLVGFAAVLFMSSAAWHGASLREYRPASARPRYNATR